MFGTLGEAFDVGSRVFGLAHCDALDCVAVFDVATDAVSFFGPLFVGSGEQFKLNQRLGQFFCGNGLLYATTARRFCVIGFCAPIAAFGV